MTLFSSKTRAIATSVALSLVVAACASPTSDTPADYDRVVGERDNLVSAIEEVEEERDAALDQLSSAEANLDTLTQSLVEVAADLEFAQADADSSATEAATARAEADALLLKYDAEIRAELQVGYDAEIARACDQAKDEYDRSISSVVQWNDAWSPIAGKAVLIAAVEDCSASERAKTADQREAERLAGCETVDVDALEKDPNRYRGECIHMWALIVQYDSATGVCSFRAEMSDRRTTTWYDYDGNGYFDSKSVTNCPELDGIDGDDYVEIWATGDGTYTYDTTIGGSATATVWVIEQIELVKKD